MPQSFEWCREAADFVSQRLEGGERGFGQCQSIGVFDGELIAGVVLHNWSPEAEVIEISAASSTPRWFSRGIAREVFKYAFGFTRMVVTRTDESNRRVRRMWAAFGGVEHIIPDLRGPGRAEVLITLKQESWEKSKFIEDKHG